MKPTAKERADALRQQADDLENEARKAERLKDAATIPTCPECGSRRFTIQAHTIVSQTISYEDDEQHGDWEDDYESGDHTDQCESATCAECEADAEAVLEKFGHTFYSDPQPKTKATP